MGKWTDKLYITHGEWATQYGGAKKKDSRAPLHTALSHDYCALTLAPFTTPVCTPDGTVYDLLPLLNHLDRHQQDPVTGTPLHPADLVRLQYAKNAAGELYCPVTLKVFTDHSHIVAVRPTGRVYSMEGMAQLVDGKGGYRDYFTDEPFARSDFITLQDPNKPVRNVQEFAHVREQASKAEPGTAGVAKARPESQPQTLALAPTAKATGTSTISNDDEDAGQNRDNKDTPSGLSGEELDMLRTVTASGKVDGRVTIRTNCGDLHFEILCRQAPLPAYKFMQLAKRGVYTAVPFHRLLPGYVLQGGSDSSGTTATGSKSGLKPGPGSGLGRGSALRHDQRGLLSMPSPLETSHFSITLGETPCLDGRQTICGRLSAGWDTLERIEATPVDPRGRPRQPLLIQDIIVIEDPFSSYQRQQQQQAERKKNKQPDSDPTRVVKRARAATHTASTIGKYMVPRGAETHSSNVKKM